ncbi:diaminopropionate ammonia-lyase [Bhargavaea ullalensis]
MKWMANPYAGERPSDLIELFSWEEAKRARKFHESLPAYAETPLYSLGGLARSFGIGGLYVKDESERFGLHAFKGLGASYALGRLHGGSGETVTFATATDGNHGKGLAWAARELGQRAVVFLPAGSAKERVDAIREQGADARVTELNYDDTVRLAEEEAACNGWVLVQATAWTGYEKVPRLIMQGYLTLIDEAFGQLEEASAPPVTHLFLQAGVGSFAAAMAAYVAARLGKDAPKIIVMEPDKADCFYRSALKGDGAAAEVGGDLDTMMAGLACGVPSPDAWAILKPLVSHFASCSDEVSTNGMRILSRPSAGDPRVVSGESGAAVAVGLLGGLTSVDREMLGLDASSVVLAVNTEGDTDPGNFRRITGGMGARPQIERFARRVE